MCTTYRRASPSPLSGPILPHAPPSATAYHSAPLTHATYLTGRHAGRFDFPGSVGLQRITREIFERGGVVGAVCHGYCGLLETTLSDGSHLVAGRNLTGFSWHEEVLARVDKLVPYDVEQRMKDLGANYSKALVPFVSNAVVDGNLVTGQNPGSAKETATKVAALLA